MKDNMNVREKFVKAAGVNSELMQLDKEPMLGLNAEDAKQQELAKKLQALDMAYPGSGETMRDFLVELGLSKTPLDI